MHYDTEEYRISDLGTQSYSSSDTDSIDNRMEKNPKKCHECDMVCMAVRIFMYMIMMSAIFSVSKEYFFDKIYHDKSR